MDANIDGEEEIEAAFEDLAVDVPLAMGPETPHATWRFDGTVRVRTAGVRATLAEWLEWWDRDDRP